MIKDRIRNADKKYKYMIMTLVSGLILSVCIFLSEKDTGYLKSGNVLIRNEYGEGAYEASVKVSDGENEETLNLTVEERKYTDAELDELIEELLLDMCDLMCGENPSLSEVNRDLKFPGKVDGYPFSIRWESMAGDVIDNTGALLCEEGCEETHDVSVAATFIYGDYRYEKVFEIRVIPYEYSPVERSFINIRKEIDKVLSNETEGTLILPVNDGNKSFSYSEEGVNNGIIMLVLTLFLTPLVGISSEYDEKKKKEKELKLLNDAYSLFVEKLKLYMVSGLTVKNSFLMIEKSLDNSNAQRDKALFKYVKMACNRYKNGVSEEKILSEFGNSCGSSYKKLMLLLTVNLKQGNERIITLMEEESEKALSMRRENAKKKGDEASVKLLFPMMLMMLIIMALIIMPAYLNFN